MQETMQNTRKPGISIIIPAYNEEGRIGNVLKKGLVLIFMTCLTH